MTLSVKHKFQSAIPDAGDPNIVQPSNWNDEHALTQATATILGRVSALTGDTEELTPAQARTLLNVADGATSNSTDAFLLARANHTGTQLAATISNFSTAADARIAAAVGVSVQAFDADLTAWAGVNPSSYSTTAQIAAAYQPLDADLTAWAAVNPSSYSTAAQIAAAYQPLDSDLTSWAGVTRAAGFDTFATTPNSSNLRALLSDEVGTGAAYFVGGALGTPASGTATNLTGLPVAGISGLGAGVATFLATPSSANLAAALTNETGTAGSVVMSDSPALTGTPTAPTAAPGTNTTQMATTAFTAAAVAAAAPNYGAGNAALAFGAVGTYAQVFSLTATLITEGLTMAGSTLQPAGFSEAVTTDPGDDTTYGAGGAPFIKGGTALSGTWRAMGRVSTGGGAIRRRTFLAMRIS